MQRVFQGEYGPVDLMRACAHRMYTGFVEQVRQWRTLSRLSC